MEKVCGKYRNLEKLVYSIYKIIQPKEGNEVLKVSILLSFE